MQEYPLEVWWAMLNDWLLGAALLIIVELWRTHKKHKALIAELEKQRDKTNWECYLAQAACRGFEQQLREYRAPAPMRESLMQRLADKSAEVDKQKLEVNRLRKALAQAENEAASAKLTLDWLTRYNLS